VTGWPFLNDLTDLNYLSFLFTLLPKQSGARAVDLPTRLFDLACPGVALPLRVLTTIIIAAQLMVFSSNYD